MFSGMDRMRLNNELRPADEFEFSGNDGREVSFERLVGEQLHIVDVADGLDQRVDEDTEV